MREILFESIKQLSFFNGCTVLQLTNKHNPRGNYSMSAIKKVDFESKYFTVHEISNGIYTTKTKPNEEGKFLNDKGQEIQPDYSYVMNVVLDDGTETIRCAFFRNQVERLLNKTQKDMLVYKDDIAAFEPMKTELLGQQVKLVGRANRNEMFDRMEFITQLVFLNPNPQEEVERLEKENLSTSDPVQKEQEQVTTEVENIN